MNQTKRLTEALQFAETFASKSRWEYLTPELTLVGIVCRSTEFVDLCMSYHVDYQKDIKEPIYGNMTERIPDNLDYEMLLSAQFISMYEIATEQATQAGRDEMDIPHIIYAMLQLKESQANYILRTQFTDDEAELMQSVFAAYEHRDIPEHNFDTTEEDDDDDFDNIFGIEPKAKWTDLVVCVNDMLKSHNPLIGREKELERTIQVLCRRDKNNPLHVGEPGVGKTALIYGLAQMIEDGNVPDKLKGAKIYQLDMGTLVAGTQYRGEFEDRIKRIMKGVSQQPGSIVYIDEIHTLIGSGAVGGESLDGSNILKPYLEAGDIRFIGATTYKEYNKYFQKSQGMVRRFQMIDVPEPTEDDCIKILEGLRCKYEQFHNIKYEDGLMQYVVRMSIRHITNRFLPDKAIDLIDEAGAFRELHPLKGKKKQTVGKDIVNQTLKRICKLTDEMLSETKAGNDALATLESNLKSKIYGQDEAIRQVVEAVQMAKAGLNESDKPLASLLFVGPTGVGKTELCRVLAQELNIELVRFDMSEYTEKHTVAKLIGSPAGYVGYEDGGLLTDAIRKSPNCILLLDEIEKAHSDIYNILLQVMDYARLTDNRGNKADFKNVILVMTSNAGAQHASQAAVGFGNTTSRGMAMLDSVKKIFKPEFINRLSGIVVFNDMDRTMANLILEKKIGELQERLKSKNVTISVSPEAKDYLLEKGFTTLYGAREIDRVIRHLLNPLLIHEILFGSLREGGTAQIGMNNNQLTLGV